MSPTIVASMYLTGLGTYLIVVFSLRSAWRNRRRPADYATNSESKLAYEFPRLHIVEVVTILGPALTAALIYPTLQAENRQAFITVITYILATEVALDALYDILFIVYFRRRATRAGDNQHAAA